MRFPASLSAGSFLSDYWQKRDLFMPRALDTIEPSLTADEVAWLATLPDVESRLVFTDRATQSYRLEHGPFDESKLSSLPDRDWTLLVQDVEKHLPDFRKQFAAVDFVPDWRIDDLMVSVAAPGGNVGPHKDNYDVFLCQGSGTRSWRLADANKVEIDPASHELSLLKPFKDVQRHTAVEGDILYLPPGVPHWGVAVDLCITYSIGMRAPNMAELRAASERLYPELTTSNDELNESATQCFYQDPGFSPDESIPGLISVNALQRMRDQRLLPNTLDDEQIAIVLGSVVTDPKAWLAPDTLSKKSAKEWLLKSSRNDELTVHGMARLAYFESADTTYFFANGFWCTVSELQSALIRKVCATRKVERKDVAGTLLDEESIDVMEWMTMHGVFDTQQ